MPDSRSTASAESLPRSRSSKKPSYWAHMVSEYERRNASLEQRQTELSERLRIMECAVPSLLMGAMVSMKRNADPAVKLLATPKTNEQTSSRSYGMTSDGKEAPNSHVRPEVTRFGKNTDFRP